MTIRPWTALAPLLLLALLIAGCGGEESVTPAYEPAGTWGQAGEGPGALRNPIGITYAAGELYVSDAGNNRIQVFDTTGTFSRQFDGSGSAAGPLLRPMHLEARIHEEGPGLQVAVPEYGADRIRLFGSEGTVQAVIGTTGTGPGELDAPGGLALGDSGRIYVAEFYNHRVQLLLPGTGQVGKWGTGSSGSKNGQFTYPTDVTLLEDGSLVVADAYNHRIQRFGPGGTHQWSLPPNTTQAGSTATRFNVATAVETGPEGRIYVADFYNHRIKIVSPEGKRLAMFGEKGTGEGQFDRPIDMAFDESGTLYVVDFGNDRIQQFEPAP